MMAARITYFSKRLLKEHHALEVESRGCHDATCKSRKNSRSKIEFIEHQGITSTPASFGHILISFPLTTDDYILIIHSSSMYSGNTSKIFSHILPCLSTLKKPKIQAVSGVQNKLRNPACQMRRCGGQISWPLSNQPLIL